MKATIIENIVTLILLGMLAGALGGLGVGLVTGHHSSTVTAQ